MPSYGPRSPIGKAAQSLGMSRYKVRKLRKEGMPVDSVDSARAWMAKNQTWRSCLQALPNAGSNPSPSEDGSNPLGAVYSFAEARARKEHHAANVAAIREQALAGTLVDLALVERILTTLAAQTRASLEQIADRLADRVASLDSPHQICELIQQEIDLTLEDLVNQIEQLEFDNPRAVLGG